MRLRLGILATTAALLLAGCTSDGAAPGPTDPDPGSGSEGPATTEPLRVDDLGGTVTYSCFPDGPRRFMLYDQVRARRPVTLNAVTGGGAATTVTGTWVAPRPRKAIPEGGGIDLDAGGFGLTDIDAWPDREPLAGAELEPGRDYTYFIRVRLRPDRTLDDFALGWDDGETTGETTISNRGRTRRGGC